MYVSTAFDDVHELASTHTRARGKLSLIDLAGSERAKKTGVMGAKTIAGGGTQNNFPPFLTGTAPDEIKATPHLERVFNLTDCDDQDL